MKAVSPNYGKRVGDSRKIRIIKAASALFIEKGYKNTSMREIADASGLNVGTLYYHVQSKENIFSLFFENSMHFLDTFAKEISSKLNNTSAESALIAAIKKYMDYEDTVQDVIVCWYQESRNLPKVELMHLMEMEINTGDIFKKILARGCKSGVFEINNLDVVAQSIIIMCDMWCFRRWYFKRRLTLEQFVDNIIQNIMRSVLADNDKGKAVRKKLKKLKIS
jgi:AcrR family transcriptional regulator